MVAHMVEVLFAAGLTQVGADVIVHLVVGAPVLTPVDGAWHANLPTATVSLGWPHAVLDTPWD